MKNNPLLDKDFLYALDQQKEKQIYARIVSLTFDELPIEQIEGKVTGGSINIDGTSAVRRTCSVNLVAEDVNIHDYYWGVNTKFQLFIGVSNNIDNEYDDIIWFKQGIFLITSFNSSLQVNNYSISIQGKDKMCLLNGDIGGVIESLTADFGKYDQIDANGNLLRRDYQIKEIIKEAVHHYGKEPYSNIIIKDLDMCGLELLEYRGDTSLFLLIQDDMVTGYRFAGESDETGYRKYDPITKEVGETISIEDEDFIYDNRISITFGEEENNPTYIVTSDDLTHPYSVAKIEFGDSCGYRETELTYVGDLIGNIGESITQAVLDKIISMLGNYEYFYDVDGHFVFQEKQNYINNSWNSIKDNGDSLFTENAAYASPVSYSFLDNNLITSFQNTPNLLNLKNDYSIWGEKTFGDNQYPIHLRYAIDQKPGYYKNFKEEVYLTQDEYDKLRFLGQLEDDIQTTVIVTSRSRFKITPLPQGLSEGWWEIDDWTRRYLYFADINDDQGRTIDDYINLTSYEVYRIVDAATRPIDTTVHDFNYYVYQLKINQLGEFCEDWATEDWLGVFPEPEGSYYGGYYSGIKSAAARGYDYWAWLFDTALDEDGNEYIRSVEHGYSTLPPGSYPTAHPGCTHVFSYALTRKNGGGYFRSYIYQPQVPDSLKTDTSFVEKEDVIDSDVTIYDAKYHICDWREIIYQMAYDYFHYQHNDNYNAIIAQNNKKYYPDGFTKYEQYYTDIYGFWRDIYNPKADGLTSHIVDLSLQNVYYWNKDEKKYELLDLQNEENVYISKPQDVNNEDGSFYYVSGKDKYSPYVVSSPTGGYYLQKTFKDLSGLRADRNYKARQVTWLSYSGYPNTNNQVYILQNNTYIPVYEPIDGINRYYTQSLGPLIDWNIKGYRRINLNRSDYVNNKYYLYENYNYILDDSNSYDANNVYYELVPQFTLGYKYYGDDGWQKTINFAAGIEYYTQHYYQKIANSEEVISGSYGITEDREAIFGESDNNIWYNKVREVSQDSTIAYEFEKFISPAVQYFDFLTTTSFNIYSKVEAFLKGKNYYYEYLRAGASGGDDYFGLEAANAWSSVYRYGLLDDRIILFKQDPELDTTYYRIVPYTGGIRYSKAYEVDYNVKFDNDTTYYIKTSESDQEVCDLSLTSKNDYYYVGEAEQSYISRIAAPDKAAIMTGNYIYLYPGDIYYFYNRQDYTNIDNGYYYMIGDYYYLSTDETFNSNQTYYYDTYGTVAPITREEYRANTFYLKDFFDAEMFTKYNVLYRFKKGFTYYAIENNINHSLLTDKNYLLATFYPKNTTVFYRMNDGGILEKVGNISSEDFTNGTYYIAYGKYNFYNYSDFIINNLAPTYSNSYNKNAIYYKVVNETLKADKYHCVGQIEEDEYVNQNLYTMSSALTFKKSEIKPTAESAFPQTYYLFPTLSSQIEINDAEDWDENFFELVNEGIYLTNEFNPETYWNFSVQNPETLIFWFDFLDISTGGDLAQYSAHLIGNRPKTINDKDVKSIYYRDIPSVIFQDNNSAYVKIFINEEIFAAGEEDYFIYEDGIYKQVVYFSKDKNHYILKDGILHQITSKDVYYENIDMYESSGILTRKYSAGIDYYRKWDATKDMNSGYTYVNLTDNISNLFTISTQKKSTFNVLDDFLYNNSYCTESITLQAIPVYYLEPNNRILVRDDSTGINGEYLVQRISYQLTHSGTMNITATKAVSRIY